MRRMVVALGSMALAVPAQASPFAKVQTGGYAGLATVGLGYGAFEDLWRGEALYGYVPASVSGIAIHSVTFKTDVAAAGLAVGDGLWIPAYVGGGLLWGLSRKVFARLPEEYPEKYYPSTALFWEGHLGTEWVFGGASSFAPASAGGTGFAREMGARHGVYAEANVHEMGLLASYDNPGYLGPRDLFTYTLGYKLRF